VAAGRHAGGEVDGVAWQVAVLGAVADSGRHPARRVAGAADNGAGVLLFYFFVFFFVSKWVICRRLINMHGKVTT
jgi:hypothetical protein